MKRSPLIILLLTVLLDLIGFGIVLPLLPVYAKYNLGASPFMIGLIPAIFPFMQFIFSPFWGKLSDKIGRRPVMLISIFITALSYLVFSQANTILLLILARGLSGIGSANIAAAQAYITDITDSKNRSGAIGMIGAAFGIGFIVGPPIGGFLFNYGIQTVGYVTATLISIDFILAIFFLPESNRNAQKIDFRFLKKKINTHEPKKSLALLLSEKTKGFVDGLRLIFSSRPLALLIVEYYLYTFAIANIQLVSMLLWQEQYSIAVDKTSQILAFVGIWSVIVQGGLIRILIKKLGEHKLFLWGHLFLFIGVFFVPFVPKNLFFSLGLFILFFFAIGTSLVSSINLSLISLYSYKQQQGQILGLSQSVNSFARILGPIIGSILYAINFHIPYIVAGILSVIGAIIAVDLFKYKIEALDTSTETGNA
ncbi:MAG: MFS transporter [Chlorobiaceae bacterium]